MKIKVKTDQALQQRASDNVQRRDSGHDASQRPNSGRIGAQDVTNSVEEALQKVALGSFRRLFFGLLSKMAAS